MSNCQETHTNCDRGSFVTIHKASLHSSYTTIPNCIFRDPNLTWVAKGVLGYLLGLPQNWQLRSCHLAKIYQGNFRGSGKNAIDTCLKELRDAGYIEYRKYQDESGKWCHRYDVHTYPVKDFQKIIPEPVEPALVERPILPKTDLRRNIEQVNDAIPETQVRTSQKNESLTCYKSEESKSVVRAKSKSTAEVPKASVVKQSSTGKSEYRGQAKYTDESRAVLDWLKKKGIDTSEATLSYWSRTYSLERLDEVYREAIARKPRSIGAYMQMLLKGKKIVCTGRIAVNVEFLRCTQDMYNLTDLKIYKKYAILGAHEINLDMDPTEFARYLMQKIESMR